MRRRVVASYLFRVGQRAQEAALKHWLGAMELANALSGKPDVGNAYQVLQDQKQRTKYEHVQTRVRQNQQDGGVSGKSKPAVQEKPEYELDDEHKEQ